MPATASTSSFCGRSAAGASPTNAAGGGGGGIVAAWRGTRTRRGSGGGELRMAESETLEFTLKKPMGLVLEENVGGFGGLRVKEIAEGGSAQVGICCCCGCGGGWWRQLSMHFVSLLAGTEPQVAMPCCRPCWG